MSTCGSSTSGTCRWRPTPSRTLRRDAQKLGITFDITRLSLADLRTVLRLVGQYHESEEIEVDNGDLVDVGISSFSRR